MLAPVGRVPRGRIEAAKEAVSAIYFPSVELSTAN
jgi:hypothetical protein